MGTCEGKFVNRGAKLRVSGCILPRELRWLSRRMWTVKGPMTREGTCQSLQSRVLSLDVDSKQWLYFYFLLFAVIICRIHCWPFGYTHYYDVIMSPSQKTPASQLLNQQFIQGADKRNIKVPCHWTLLRELTGDRWIPCTKGQWRGNDSVWWRHHPHTQGQQGENRHHRNEVLYLQYYLHWCILDGCQ